MDFGASTYYEFSFAYRKAYLEIHVSHVSMNVAPQVIAQTVTFLL
jgi:hypothetical protein